MLLLPSMFAAATIVVNSTSADFEAYKLAFGKNYTSTSEEARAKACWEENVADLAKKNEAAARAKSDLKFAENSFSDQCFADFAAQRLNLDPAANGLCTGSGGQGYPTPANESMAVDWRPKGYVNSIKNQGSCGSCWAFSAVASMEAAHFKATGELLSFAEQDLVSCDKGDGNNGCGGGMPGEAVTWVVGHGISLEKDYPYTAKDDDCVSHPKSAAKFSGFTYLDTTKSGGGESVLLAALQNEQPISIVVNANTWHQYSGGIMPASSCQSGGINHAVLAVGYGVEGGKKYYVIRNSWGVSRRGLEP